MRLFWLLYTINQVSLYC